MSEYECALSGEVADRSLLIADEEDDLPVGWTRVTFETRRINPRWSYIQNVKAALVEAALVQAPEEAREQMYPLVAMQVEAQFAALEANVGQYETVSDVVYVANPEEAPLLASEYNGIREKFGLAAWGADEDELADEE
jgi:hypothetical protein